MAEKRKYARYLTGPESMARLGKTVADALKETHISVSSKIFILKSPLHLNTRHMHLNRYRET